MSIRLAPMALFFVLVSPTSLAADDSSVVVRQTFAPADFARFAPRTALDMAQQVPGFPLDDDNNQERGFGQADTNVLVNGRRVSGKSNGPVEALSRIPVDDVVKLEIVDGASLDIGGLSGQVLNIVTASGTGITGRYNFSPETRTDHVPDQLGNVSVSISGGSDTTEWTLEVGKNQDRSGDEGPEFVTDSTGSLTDERLERRVNRFDQPSIAGSLARIADNGNVLNVTGEVNWNEFRLDEFSDRNPVGDVGRIRRLRQTEDELNYELGADYEFGVGEGRLKLIGLYRFEESPTEGQVSFEFDDQRTPTGSVFRRDADEAETVLRAEYTFGALGGDWQWSVEGTHNYLDIDAELFERDDNGDLLPVELPGASSRVEEDRAEMTLSYSRSLSEKLQLQTSFGAEYSEISQLGEFGLVRDFVRPKGFISLNWRASDELNLSAQLERRVGQLNFFDFVATVNVNQERENVTNANLVPPQSWLLDLQVQQSLGAYGSVTLGAFYEDVSDIVDQVPIEGGGQAPGNIDNAERYGLSTNLTLLFDPWGWQGARLDFEGEYIDSSVTDPLLGTSRQISDDDHIRYEATLRQDFPETQWAAGIRFFYNEDTPQVRLDEISLFRPSAPFTRFFVEHKDVFGVTVRGSIANINDRDNEFSRTVFVDRTIGAVDFREERFRDFGLIFTLDIEGSF